MPNIGPLAKRIPEVGRSLGKGIRGFKASLEGDKDEDDDQSEEDKPAALPRPAGPTAKAADPKSADEDSPVRESR
jgi:Sec-independent protein translocase protein TatA